MKTLIFAGLMGIASSAICHENTPDSDDPLSRQAKTFLGKSGHTWHYRTDDINRLISFKRLGSKGIEIQFLYEKNSSKPVAARLAGQQWIRKNVSLVDKTDMSRKCSDGNLGLGTLPAVFKPTFTHSLISKGITRMSSAPHSFKKVNFEEDDMTGYPEAEATYMDLQLMVDDFFEELSIFGGSPEQRQLCIDYCNDLTDLAWITCALFGLLGPGGAVVAAICAYHYYEKRAQCRIDCVQP